jgi:hypothetical protein
MKCDTRLLQAEDVGNVVFDSAIKTTQLRKTLSASDLKQAENFAVLLVDIPQADGSRQMFRALKNSQVPLNTEVIRNSEGQIVGIPAVSGG